MPNATQLVASPREILELAKGLVEDVRNIEAFNSQLTDDLEQIAKTWLDDGFTEVHEYLTKINKALEERRDSIGMVAQGLVTYAQLLRKTK